MLNPISIFLRVALSITRFVRPMFNRFPKGMRNAAARYIRKKSLQKLRHEKDSKIPAQASPIGSDGVNLIGYPNATSGLSYVLKSGCVALQTAGFQVSVYDIGKSSFQAQSRSTNDLPISEEAPHRINLFCMNGDGLSLSLTSLSSEFWKKKYNIQYAAWELEGYPQDWLILDRFIHEYWAISEFTAKSIRKVTNTPCFNMGIPVDFKLRRIYSRIEFKLPENRFLFFSMFDMSSTVARKNPTAVVLSYLKSLPHLKKNSAGLVLKISRVKGRAEQDSEFLKLLKLIDNNDSIFIIDSILDRDELLGLMSVCDSFVSLHRSEGFGLGLAEAMKMGKLAIATRYSGNLDFMNENNSLLVDFSLVRVKDGEYPYGEGQYWADPSPESASKMMTLAATDPISYKVLAQKGQKDIYEKYSYDAFKEKLRNRLKQLSIRSLNMRT